ncbi:MAG: tRNA-dihydrouridine synthase family protein [Kofleriaceae bacterium]|nr:tRNA-dihydrouridine synthase family protein [Kofleriaceae bacterium]
MAIVPLPWKQGQVPVMLAPMQGLTNRALRHVYAGSVRPDVLFTEFVRVRPRAKKLVAQSDFTEALAEEANIPLVVQVIGSAEEGVVEATRELVERGVRHINVNMGCPFGRMTSILAGGGMFRSPQTVEPLLRELRSLVPGSLSVKTRLGLDDERQLFDILPAFENAGIDFLVVHSRTVKQKYKGEANHSISHELVARTSLPLIANGDIRTASQATSVLKQTGASGLMLGRGAIADPWLFERIRGNVDECPSVAVRKRELASHLSLLLDGYSEIFCGEAQIMSKLRETFAHFREPELRRWGRKLSKRKLLSGVAEMLAEARG